MVLCLRFSPNLRFNFGESRLENELSLRITDYVDNLWDSLPKNPETEFKEQREDEFWIVREYNLS